MASSSSRGHRWIDLFHFSSANQQLTTMINWCSQRVHREAFVTAMSGRSELDRCARDLQLLQMLRTVGIRRSSDNGSFDAKQLRRTSEWPIDTLDNLGLFRSVRFGGEFWSVTEHTRGITLASSNSHLQAVRSLPFKWWQSAYSHCRWNASASAHRERASVSFAECTLQTSATQHHRERPARRRGSYKVLIYWNFILESLYGILYGGFRGEI